MSENPVAHIHNEQESERPLFINIIKNPLKRVCIINKEGIIMRVTRTLAAKMVAESSTWNYTSKSKLKSFLNREAKLHRNKKAIHTFGTTGGEFTLQGKNKRYTYLTLYKFIHSFSRGIKTRATNALKKLSGGGGSLSSRIDSHSLLNDDRIGGIRSLDRSKYRDMSMNNFKEGLADMPENKKTFETGKAIMITRFSK